MQSAQVDDLIGGSAPVRFDRSGCASALSPDFPPAHDGTATFSWRGTGLAELARLRLIGAEKFHSQKSFKHHSRVYGESQSNAIAPAVKNDVAKPMCPARPVRPIRCT